MDKKTPGTNWVIMFLDTETTDLIKDLNTPYNDDTLANVWPYITELSYIVAEYDSQLSSPKVLKTSQSYIYPTYPQSLYSQEAQSLTHISYDKLLQEGLPPKQVLSSFITDLHMVDAVVCHNTRFDMKMIKAEFLRHSIDQHLRIVPFLDSMYHGYFLTRGKNSRGGAKYPTLSELYQKVTSKVFDSAHSAIADVSALKICFEGLTSIKVVNKYGDFEPVLSPRHFVNLYRKFQPSDAFSDSASGKDFDKVKDSTSHRQRVDSSTVNSQSTQSEIDADEFDN